jgi:ADP-ribosylglycohydrolase
MTSSSDQNTPLFSLVRGEGSGSMLGAAAGDVAGGQVATAYSSLTQCATVLAYHLLENDGVEPQGLASGWLELLGEEEVPSVYRGVSSDFERWLTAARAGEAAATAVASFEPAARIHPIGVWFRRRPELLVEAAIRTARLTHMDAVSVVAAVAVAGGVAASCYGQVGRDLLLGAAEVAGKGLETIEGEEYLFSRVAEARLLVTGLAGAVSGFAHPAREIPADLPEPSHQVLAALRLAATPGEPHRLIEQASQQGGSALAAAVGAMVGARVGIRSWPWVIPNDTWFVEIGRRLVAGNRETRDIPVPYMVEERITLGVERDLL